MTIALQKPSYYLCAAFGRVLVPFVVSDTCHCAQRAGPGCAYLNTANKSEQAATQTGLISKTINLDETTVRGANIRRQPSSYIGSLFPG